MWEKENEALTVAWGFLASKHPHIFFLVYFTQTPCVDRQGESHFVDEDIEVEEADLMVTLTFSCTCFLGPSLGSFSLHWSDLSHHSL